MLGMVHTFSGLSLCMFGNHQIPRLDTDPPLTDKGKHRMFYVLGRNAVAGLLHADPTFDIDGALIAFCQDVGSSEIEGSEIFAGEQMDGTFSGGGMVALVGFLTPEPALLPQILKTGEGASIEEVVFEVIDHALDFTLGAGAIGAM